MIDVSNSPTPDDAAKEFVDTAPTNLLEAESQAGVSHSARNSLLGTEDRRFDASQTWRDPVARV